MESTSPSPPESPTFPNGISVETLYDTGDFLWKDSTHRGRNVGANEVEWAIISDRDSAHRAFIIDEELNAFVEETNFSESYLLLIRYGTRSVEVLHLDAIERINNGLWVTIFVEDNPGGDDLVTHPFLLRITDSENGVAEDVNVELEGHVRN